MIKTKTKTKGHFIWVSNVFSTKVLIRDTIFTSPNGDGTAILLCHPSHAKVQPPAGQRKYLHFSVILRPWVLVRPRESNPRPSALQSSALPTKLILSNCYVKVFFANASEDLSESVFSVCERTGVFGPQSWGDYVAWPYFLRMKQRRVRVDTGGSPSILLLRLHSPFSFLCYPFLKTLCHATCCMFLTS